MSQSIIAIDPGASGGMAFFRDGKTWCEPMPESEGDVIEELRLFMHGLNAPVAYVEQVGGFVKGSPAPGSAMFNFGRNFGFILGALQALHYRVELVRPAKWQQALGVGTAKACSGKTEWKNKLKQKAQQLYPGLKVTLATSDALLILEYGRKAL